MPDVAEEGLQEATKEEASQESAKKVVSKKKTFPVKFKTITRIGSNEYGIGIHDLSKKEIDVLKKSKVKFIKL